MFWHFLRYKAANITGRLVIYRSKNLMQQNCLRYLFSNITGCCCLFSAKPVTNVVYKALLCQRCCLQTVPLLHGSCFFFALAGHLPCTGYSLKGESWELEACTTGKQLMFWFLSATKLNFIFVDLNPHISNDLEQLSAEGFIGHIWKSNNG